MCIYDDQAGWTRREYVSVCVNACVYMLIKVGGQEVQGKRLEEVTRFIKVCIHTCVCVYVYDDPAGWTRREYAYVCVYVCVCMLVKVGGQEVRGKSLEEVTKLIKVCIHTCLCVCVCVFVYLFIYACVYICIYLHTHTHT